MGKREVVPQHADRQSAQSYHAMALKRIKNGHGKEKCRLRRLKRGIKTGGSVNEKGRTPPIELK